MLPILVYSGSMKRGGLAVLSCQSCLDGFLRVPGVSFPRAGT